MMVSDSRVIRGKVTLGRAAAGRAARRDAATRLRVRESDEIRRGIRGGNRKEEALDDGGGLLDTEVDRGETHRGGATAAALGIHNQRRRRGAIASNTVCDGRVMAAMMRAQERPAGATIGGWHVQPTLDGDRKSGRMIYGFENVTGASPGHVKSFLRDTFDANHAPRYSGVGMSA